MVDTTGAVQTTADGSEEGTVVRKSTKSRPRLRPRPVRPLLGHEGLDPFYANAGTCALANGRAALLVFVSPFALGPWPVFFAPISTQSTATYRNPPQSTSIHPTHACTHPSQLAARFAARWHGRRAEHQGPSRRRVHGSTELGFSSLAVAVDAVDRRQGQSWVIPAGSPRCPSRASYEEAQEGRRGSTFEPLFPEPPVGLARLGMGPARFPKQMSGRLWEIFLAATIRGERPGRPPVARPERVAPVQ